MSQPPPDLAERRAFLRHPVADMLFIAAPSIVQMSSYTAMQFMDSWMVSAWGDSPIFLAAQGNASMSAWVPISLFVGMSGVVNSFVAQNLGAGSPRMGARYAWAQIWICLAAAVALLGLIPLLPTAYRAAGHDPTLIRLETSYATVLIATAVLPMTARAIAQYFFGMHKPIIPMAAALAGNAVNVLANYALIFGHFGLPELGIMGAAWGTVIGGVVELVIPAVVFLGPRWAPMGTRSAWRPRLKPIWDVLRVGTPAGLMFVNEMICFGYLLVVLGGAFGPAQQAAGFVALRYMSLSFMPTVGLSIAITAVVGRLIGMGMLDRAARRAWLGVGLGVAYMGLCAVGFVVFRHELVGLFLSDGARPEHAAVMLDMGAKILIAAAVFQVFDAVAVTLTGALRGAGDTLVPSVLTIGLSWLLIVGGGHLAVELAPELGALGPWLGASAYIVVLGVALLIRFKLGAWKRMKLSGDEVVV